MFFLRLFRISVFLWHWWGLTMKINSLNKSENFTFEDRLMKITSKDAFYKRNNKNYLRIKPLAVALSVVLTGFTFSERFEAVAYDSPWIVEKSATVNISSDSQINVTNPIDSAIAIIYGTVNYTSNVSLYTNYKTGLPYNSYNSITVYGNINGAGGASNLMVAYTTTDNAGCSSIQNNNNTLIFKAGSHVKKIIHIWSKN